MEVVARAQPRTLWTARVLELQSDFWGRDPLSLSLCSDCTLTAGQEGNRIKECEARGWPGGDRYPTSELP